MTERDTQIIELAKITHALTKLEEGLKNIPPKWSLSEGLDIKTETEGLTDEQYHG
ncbi:hypothetical protein PXY30_004447 [Salmonella enterica]|nr:hypothetical protein [Salmonella enterica]